ncbi:DUF4167 domain-containing protein [Albimonas sp. CAU 1670]|uniref:DUF4167 domain-containing protein n=1 Tax=Albimonas sp. CAU 1670 TaxID=3032599 RepID=UPI0023D9AAC5|nr:DUF4167 domain-containing protein [Albimonas sp. CAU 1670]MDF2234517.1 DUF4167 domain-containing protein [Albimonas sp. CAU 1670]
MRPSQKSNRNRGKNNRPKGLGNVVNRVFESAGPEGKVRGTPQQIIDKYEQLARDAQTAGDRVTAENFLQHAEHYLRMLSAAQAEQQAHQQSQNQQPHVNGHARRDGDDEGRDRQPSGSDASQPETSSQDEPRAEAPRAEGGRKGEGRKAKSEDAPSGGMETIEPEGDEPASALVATPEAGEEQPRPRARRRRTRRDKPAEGEAAGGDEPKGGADAEVVGG